MEQNDLNLFKIFIIIIKNLKFISNTIWPRLYWVHLGVPDVTLIN